MIDPTTIITLTEMVQNSNEFKALKGPAQRGAAGFFDCCRGLSSSPDADTFDELVELALEYQLITSGQAPTSKYAEGATVARDLLKEAYAAR